MLLMSWMPVRARKSPDAVPLRWKYGTLSLNYGKTLSRKQLIENRAGVGLGLEGTSSIFSPFDNLIKASSVKSHQTKVAELVPDQKLDRF